MNTPALAGGNWSWRAPEGSWTPEFATGLANLVDITDLDNDPLAPAVPAATPSAATFSA
jgi:4-alpha-glucanotransferase